MRTVKEMGMLAAKIDLLLKKIEGYTQDKAQTQTLQSFGCSHDMRGLWKYWTFG